MPGALFAPFRRQKRRKAGAFLPTPPAAPDTPSTPSPADTVTAYYSLLSWVSARATNADVYLDTVNPPLTIVGIKLQSTSYVPTLLPATTYYWKIAAFNAGGSATGPVWSFTTPAATAVPFELAGAITTGARWPSLSIHDVLGAQPNTGSVTFGTAKTAGTAVKIGLGMLDDSALIFGGEIQAVDQDYQGLPDVNPLWHASLIDQTFRLNKRRPFGNYVNVSASVITRTLVALYAPDFTSIGVQDGLPAISINFDGSADFMSCMRTLATAISDFTIVGKTKVTYARDVQLYLTSTDASPDPIDADHPPLDKPSPITFSVDHSQIRDRVYGKGHGENVPTDVPAGSVFLPLPDTSMFNPVGGMAIVATTPNGAQTTIITYEGVQLGGGGSLVGPGAAPSVRPSIGFVVGSGLSIGTYQYAYTFVTPSGESLPSPVGIITTDAVNGQASVSDVALGSGATTSRNVYRTAVNGSQLKFLAALANNTSTFLFNDNTPDASLGANAPTTDTSALTQPSGQVNAGTTSLLTVSGAPFSASGGWASLSGGQTISYTGVGGYYFPPTPMVLALVAGAVLGVGVYQYAYTDVTALGESLPSPLASITTTAGNTSVSLNGVAVGRAGTLTRNVYRTVVNGSQLKFLGNLGNNSATFLFNDATADGGLGANPPVLDTSGLNQSALTGIPATGPGSIMTTVLYGSPVVPMPALTGINSWNGIPLAMATGSSVNIWVQRNDTAAQAALVAIEGGDGIREYLIVNGSRGEDSLIAECDADLAQFSRPIVSATYYTRDPKTKAGRTVHIDVSSGTFDPLTFDHDTLDIAFGFGQAGDFTIQSVDITFDAPSLYPLRRVTASSTAFTLANLLQRVAIV